MKKKLKLVHEILDLCMEINKTTKHSTFFNWSGHVELISVFYYLDGWVGGKDYDRRTDINLTSSKAMQELTLLKHGLTALLDY